MPDQYLTILRADKYTVCLMAWDEVGQSYVIQRVYGGGYRSLENARAMLDHVRKQTDIEVRGKN